MYAAEAKDSMIIDSHIQKVGISGLFTGAFIGLPHHQLEDMDTYLLELT